MKSVGEEWQVVTAIHDEVMVCYFFEDTHKVMATLILIMFILGLLEVTQWLPQHAFVKFHMQSH
jgi:hypothetical protein